MVKEFWQKAASHIVSLLRIQLSLCWVHRSFSVGRTIPKLPFTVGISTPIIILWTRASQHPKPHLDQLNRFAELTNATNRQTFTHSYRPRYSVCSNRPHLYSYCCDARPKIYGSDCRMCIYPKPNICGGIASVLGSTLRALLLQSARS